jgi:hypothetical protein
MATAPTATTRIGDDVPMGETNAPESYPRIATSAAEPAEGVMVLDRPDVAGTGGSAPVAPRPV